MNITNFLHTSILVSNLEKADFFYSQILGLTKIERNLKFPGVWYQIGDYQIHLIVDSQRKVNINNEEKWGQNPHLALGVTDLEEAKEKLETNGYSYQISNSGRRALFTQDPDKNIIEITEI